MKTSPLTAFGTGILSVVVATTGCGVDYSPPSLPTTGVPAGPLGQVLDLDLDFPDMRVLEGDLPGVRFEMRVEMERVGYGDLEARVFYDDARGPLRSYTIEDLSQGRATITITPDRWSSGVLGPIRVGGSSFAFVLDGVPSIDTWHVTGGAVSGQSLEIGSFEAWREHRFLVAGTDFFSSAGSIEEVALVRENELRVRHRLELVSSDPVLRVTGGALFAVNRLSFDNLQRLDPMSNFATTWQASVGAGANPQDVLLPSADKGYVTRYEPPFNDVAVFDPERGTIRASIPLGPYAQNRDATPRAAVLRMAEGSVFVGLQDIDRSFSRFEDGKLAVIDPALDQVVDVIPLQGKNPYEMQVVRAASGREKLYVALAGIFPGLQAQELSGGVVVVDAGNRVVERFALDDDTAGGNVTAVAMAGERLGYVIVSDASFVNRVMAFDPVRGTILRTVRVSSEQIPEIALDTKGLLAVPDRRFIEPQTCLYRTPADPLQPETFVWCITMELPPFSIVALD